MNKLIILGVCVLGLAYGQQSTEVGPCHMRNSGFARDLSDCQRYFVCQNGQAVRQTCPNNLWFDAESEMCTWRQQASCFSCPAMRVHSLVAVPSTCHQFYRCWHNRVTIHTCPSGLVFDPNTRQCSHPFGTGCEGDENLASTCPRVDGAEPVYLADAFSCSAFHLCQGGEPIRQECPSGLHYNAHLQICDVPENARCQIQEAGWGSDPWNEGWGAAFQQDHPAIPCPTNGPRFVPHRDNCNAYFACSGNHMQRPSIIHCAPGLHFDFHRESCALPAQATCWSAKNPPRNDHSNFIGNPWGPRNATVAEVEE